LASDSKRGSSMRTSAGLINNIFGHMTKSIVNIIFSRGASVKGKFGIDRSERAGIE
jgi:hypothetical protein